MPDASDWKRNPNIMAKAVHDALEKPDNPLRTWDPSVQGASKAFLLKTHKWDFNTHRPDKTGLFDEKMRNNLLVDPPVIRREHVKFPRSDMGFKSLGALDHWRCIDGIGKVGAVKDRFSLSLLQHPHNGIFVELLHFSPGFFCFQAAPGGPILCCTEEARVKERSDLQNKGDGKGPPWKFHSPETVAEYLAPLVRPSTSASRPKTQSTTYSFTTSESSEWVEEDEPKGQNLRDRFTTLTSSVPGRWVVATSVPHVFIANNCDPLMQIVLTRHGFVVLGGGADPQGLIVEKGTIRSLSVGAAIDYVRHRPAKEDDLTELDHLGKLQHQNRNHSTSMLEKSFSNVSVVAFQDGSTSAGRLAASPEGIQRKEDLNAVLEAERRMLKLDLDKFFERENVVQKSYEEMVLKNGFRDCCSLIKRLHGHLSIGEILDASDRINRRAQLVRVTGDYGKECVPGTGTTTQFAFLIDEIRSKIAKQGLKAVFVHFFRMEYHKPHEVVSHLARQLIAHMSEEEEGLNDKMIKALSSYSHEEMAKLLEHLCMHHVLKDHPVIIVVDNLHLAEQRILGLMIYELRKALQPWFYHLKRHGYVRVVFSGRDGYSAPQGGSITTLQLNRLSDTMAKKVLTKMFRVRKKHISPDHVETLLKKKDACRMQYLRTAVSVVQRYWVFEQNNGYVEALPEELSGLYIHSIRNLENDFGPEFVQKTLLMIISTEHQHTLTFEELQQKLSREGEDAKSQELQRIHELFDVLRELLRLAPTASRCITADEELKNAIRFRYSSPAEILKTRLQETQEKNRIEDLRKEQLEKCVASVLEKHNNIETGCISVHQAVDAAAAGDEVIVHKKTIHLKGGLLINRNLTVSCHKPDTVITIGYGQTIIQVGDDELHRLEPQDQFTVTISGLTMKQSGFEAAELPYTVRVSANAKLHLKHCQVTSDRAVGILVDDGLLVMEESKTVLCGAQGMLVQEGGKAELDRCQIVANWLPNISPAEKEMHEMFIAFCKGENAHMYERRLEVESHSEKQQIKLSGLGKRGTTLDFFEFIEVLKFLKVYPALITKTEASNLFKQVNASEEGDDDASEMDWVEFKNLMHMLCITTNQDGFMGVSKEDLIPKASDREEAWKSANGVYV